MKILKILVVILIVILTLIIITVSTFLVIREIKINKLEKELAITTENGIDEFRNIEIGGFQQAIYIRGENKNNPIILAIHGGPGSPLMPLSYVYQQPLEKDYTVVNWDQRNSGKSYYLNDPKEVYDTLTLDRMLLDVKEVVDYLLNEFNQQKIIILGHSWGTILGSMFSQDYPNLVQAYIGVGQVVDCSGGDQLAFTTAINKAKEENNLKDVKAMESLTNYLVSDENFSYKNFMKERAFVDKYLGLKPKPNYTFPLFYSPFYKLKEDFYFLKNSVEINGPLIKELGKFDIGALSKDYQVPTFLIFGDHDWTTPYVLGQEYYETITAPKKGIYIIDNASHAVMLDQPEEFTDTVLAILASLNS